VAFCGRLESSVDELCELDGVPGLVIEDTGRQLRWYMFRRGISYVPGCVRMCSRMSWYEPPAVEVAASEDDRVWEAMVWRRMGLARRDACFVWKDSAFHLNMRPMFFSLISGCPGCRR